MNTINKLTELKIRKNQKMAQKNEIITEIKNRQEHLMKLENYKNELYNNLTSAEQTRIKEEMLKSMPSAPILPDNMINKLNDITIQ
ncbi:MULTISPECIES: hypothetical protein [unclassified Spiroplasma]|uniref:hypothetical protein n=1 Tax=unclassified Spiroplasma TaxID=2637901 RepID=UPI00313E87A7